MFKEGWMSIIFDDWVSPRKVSIHYGFKYVKFLMISNGATQRWGLHIFINFE